MNTYEITYKDGSKEIIKTKKELTGVIGCYAEEHKTYTASLTSAKNVQAALQRERSYNRPWLTDWHLAEFKKI